MQANHRFGYRTAALLRWSAAAFLAVTSISCNPPQSDSTEAGEQEDVIPFRVDGHLQILRGTDTLASLEIEIAENDSTRTRGMMQRNHLPTDRGMLFIFETEQDRAFWMANTPLSLDLVFINRDSVVTHLAKYMRPLSPQDVPSDGPAQFVLELIAGNADTIGIIEGDRVTWTRLDRE